MPENAKKPPRSLVVFDFDGTITTSDTFALFLRFYAGPLKWALKLARLLPVFISYKLGFIDRHAVKSAVIQRFFGGEPITEVEAKAEVFAHTVIPKLIRPKAQAEFDTKKLDLESLYICSASIGPYLRVWAEDQGLPKTHVLATELEVSDGVCSGRVHGYNIWGKNKVRRIFDEFAPQKVNIKEAYGDSRGDKELLHAAEVSFYKPFRV